MATRINLRGSESGEGGPHIDDADDSPSPDTDPKDGVPVDAEAEARPTTIEERFEERFHISAKELHGVEGFDDLSPGRQRLVFENLQQLTLGRIQEEAGKKYRADVANTGKLSLKRLWLGASRQFQIARKERASAEKIQLGGFTEHSQILEQLVKGAMHGPDVKLENDERIRIRFSSQIFNETAPMSPEDRKQLDDIDKTLHEFSSVPYEWSLPSATFSHRQTWTKAKAEYDRATGVLATLAPFRASYPDTTANVLQYLDRQVRLHQFLNTHPDAEKALDEIQSVGLWDRVISNTISERGLYFSAGLAARSLTIGALGLLAAPLTAAGMGAVSAYLRGRENIRTDEQLQRRGAVRLKKIKRKGHQETEDGVVIGTIKEGTITRESSEYVTASDLNRRLNEILGRVYTDRTSERSPNKKALTRAHLDRLTKYASALLADGRINFGASDLERITNQRELFSLLGDAWSYAGSAEEEMDGRLKKLVGARREKVSREKREQLLKQVGLGVLFGAGSATAGQLVAGLIHGKGATAFEQAPAKGKRFALPRAEATPTGVRSGGTPTIEQTLPATHEATYYQVHIHSGDVEPDAVAPLIARLRTQGFSARSDGAGGINIGNPGQLDDTEKLVGALQAESYKVSFKSVEAPTSVAPAGATEVKAPGGSPTTEAQPAAAPKVDLPTAPTRVETPAAPAAPPSPPVGPAASQSTPDTFAADQPARKVTPTPADVTPPAEPTPSAPTEAAPAGTFVEKIQSGDSVWKIAERQLNREGNPWHDRFVGLNKAQQTYVIDAIKDRVVDSPEAFGLESTNLKVGEELDLWPIFVEEDAVKGFFEKADQLNPGEIENITQNNQRLQEWAKANPGKPLPEELVNAKGKVPTTAQATPAEIALPPRPAATAPSTPAEPAPQPRQHVAAPEDLPIQPTPSLQEALNQRDRNLNEILPHLKELFTLNQGQALSGLQDYIHAGGMEMTPTEIVRAVDEFSSATAESLRAITDEKTLLQHSLISNYVADIFTSNPDETVHAGAAPFQELAASLYERASLSNTMRGMGKLFGIGEGVEKTSAEFAELARYFAERGKPIEDATLYENVNRITKPSALTDFASESGTSYSRTFFERLDMIGDYLREKQQSHPSAKSFEKLAQYFHALHDRVKS